MKIFDIVVLLDKQPYYPDSLAHSEKACLPVIDSASSHSKVSSLGADHS